MDRAAVTEVLGEVARVESWATALRSRCTRRLRRLAAEAPGPDPVKDVGDSTRGGRDDARRGARRSETLDDLPAVEDALDDGEVTGGHVDAMGRALQGLDDDTRRDLVGDGGDALVDRARGRTPEQLEADLRREIRRRQRQAEDQALRERDRQQRANRLRLWHDRQTGMWRLVGDLDGESGLRLRNRLDRALHALFAETTPATAPTDPLQRVDHLRALALLRLLDIPWPEPSTPPTGPDASPGPGPGHRPSGPGTSPSPGPGTAGPGPSTPPGAGPAGPGPSTPPGAGPAGPGPSAGPGPGPGKAGPGASTPASGGAAGPGPRPAGRSDTDLIVVIDLATLLHGLHEHSTIDPGHPDVDLPATTALRLACDAGIIPVVLDGDGLPLHVGRTRRLATEAQRRALRVIYPTCAIDGCPVGFDHCRIHHIAWWEHHGPTDLANLLPLCHRHHTATHEGRWQLHLAPDRTLTTTHPDGTRITHPPPRRIRPRGP